MLKIENVLNQIVKEIKDVAETGILPDGDHLDHISTILWLEDLIQYVENQLNEIKNYKND